MSTRQHLWSTYHLSEPLIPRFRLSIRPPSIGDILCHWCLSLFGHVAHYGPRSTSTWCSAPDGRKLMASWRRWRVALATPGSTTFRRSQRSTAIYAVEIWDHQGSGAAQRSTRTTRQWRWWWPLSIFGHLAFAVVSQTAWNSLSDEQWTMTSSNDCFKMHWRRSFVPIRFVTVICCTFEAFWLYAIYSQLILTFSLACHWVIILKQISWISHDRMLMVSMQQKFDLLAICHSLHL